MAVQYSPRTVTDGLTVCLDSTNNKSYPGNGSVWYDVSGNNNHATLYNMTGPSAGSTSGFDTTTKYMMFDRHLGTGDGTANNYALINNSTTLQDCLPQNGMSINMWIKMTTYYCTAITKWDGSWEIYYCSPLVWRTQGTGGTDGNSGLPASTYLNQFHHIVATHSGTTRRFYVNGTLYYEDSNTVTAQNTSNPVSIGAYSNGIYAFNGAIPYYSLYNKVLSANEVLQNFNATRSRFGI